jgi:hypothetical protein
MPKNYWMLVTSPEVLAETLAQRRTSQRVPAQHRRKLERMEPGDKVVYYLTPSRRFAAAASVASRSLESVQGPGEESSGELLFKVFIQPEMVLGEADYLDARQIGPRMEYTRKWIPEKWFLAFHGFLHLIPKNDYALLEGEMRKVLHSRQSAPRPG